MLSFGERNGLLGAILLASLVYSAAAQTLIDDSNTASTRVTTSFYSFVTTQIPRDEKSIGMGLQREGTDEYCELQSTVLHAVPPR
jgi:hypothetical protein